MAVNLINSNDIEVTQIGENIQLKTSTPITTINGNIGQLSSLTTTDKSSLVNAINEVNNIAEKNIITCKLETSASYTTNSIIPLNNVISVGSKLTYSNSKIKIGAGVNKVLISGQLYVNYPATNSKVYGYSIACLKSGESTPTTIIGTRTQKPIGEPLSISSAPILFNVNENDEIYMEFITSSTSSQLIQNNTYVTVEVIE